MFDKLIASEPEGADFKNRRSYFMVSSLVVGVLFLTAVVISIFAADFGLGSSSFELTQMIAPPEMAAVEPDPQPQRQQSQAQSQLPTRQASIARMNDTPPSVPTTTSTMPNTTQERPRVPFDIGPSDTNPDNSNGSGRNTTGTSSNNIGLSTPPQVDENTTVPQPPPIKDPPPVKKPTIQSLGVINGKATSLPHPPYPPPAKAVGASGKVDVQVLIDESGKVISANAVNGHPLLRAAAEKAAWGARFSPTYLSKVPVKVTGVIVYNFVR